MHRRAWALLLPLSLAACGPPLIRARDIPPPPVPMAESATAAVPTLPPDYAATPEAVDLVDPRAVALAPDGSPVVVEGVPARLTRIEADGRLVPLAQGGGNGPWTAAAWVGGRFYVAEAGAPGGLGGRILRVDPGGGLAPVLEGLPAGTPATLTAGPDGALYVAVSSATNAGVPVPGSARDVPCEKVDLRNGRHLAGHTPCTGAVLRMPPGGDTEVYAWGFRRPVGLAFAPDGRLLLAEQSYRADPVRAVQAQPDLLWAVTPGVWYGWPDYQGQLALADPLLADVPNPPPPPLSTLAGEVRGLAVASDPVFGPPGEPFVALTGGTVAFVDPRGGQTPFAAGLREPTALAFSPDGRILWVADAGSGRLWRITAPGR
ncbi:MAG: PQQ-dependent sugar dehydrogenase [Actinomycetota bacterium]